MRRKTRRVVGEVLFWIGFFMTFFWGLWGGLDYMCTPRYSGTEIFWQEGEYVAFKRAIANADGTLEEATVLSSTPPIVVTYTIKVPKGTEFPYGNLSGTEIPFEDNWLTFLIVGGSLLGAGALLAAFSENEKSTRRLYYNGKVA